MFGTTNPDGVAMAIPMLCEPKMISKYNEKKSDQIKFTEMYRNKTFREVTW